MAIWAQMIPLLMNIASKNSDGMAKAQNIGAMLRKSIGSGKTAKSIKQEIYH